MALAARFTSRPDTLLAIAKISTLLLNLANILLIRRWLSSWTSELLGNLVAGSIGCGLMFFETINGMETPLIMALVLVMLLLRSSQRDSARVFYLLAGCAFLLTRWEAAWLLLPFLLVEKTFRRALIASGTWLAVFLLSNVVRWRYFGSLLPNTIIAKHGFPYSAATPHLERLRHINEPIHLLASCKIFLLAFAIGLIYEKFAVKPPTSLVSLLRSSLRNSWQLRFAFLFTLFSLILTTAIGQNWGPEFRSFYSAWPFLFCLLLLPALRSPKSPLIPWITVGVCAFALLRAAARIHDLSLPNGPPYMPGATVGDVQRNEVAISKIQSASHHANVLFAGPDMGAIMLYSNGVRLIDLGLLCDPVLARLRYDAIDSYVLQQRHPDIIEVHQLWTQLTSLEASPTFAQNYRPLYVDGVRFFVRPELIHDIDANRLTQHPFDASGVPLASELPPASRKKVWPEDRALNQIFKTYYVLSANQDVSSLLNSKGKDTQN